MNNKEDKPSFFDPSEEASTWPPSDSYEPDDETGSEADSHINYVDSILNDISGFDGGASDSRSEELALEQDDFLVPLNEEKTTITDEEDLTETESISQDQEEQTELVSIENQEEILDNDESTLNEVIDEPETQSSNNENFNVDDLFDSKVESTENQNQTTDTSHNSSSTIYTFETEESLKPFRAYSAIDYNEVESPAEATEDTALGSILKKVNKNVLILALVVIAFGIYYLVSSLNSRNPENFKQTRRERPPRKAKQVAQELRSGNQSPVWEVSSQKNISSIKESELVKFIFASSGRANPFAIPDSILADYRKAAEIAIVKQQEPNTYKRIAYRATLVGVLTSADSTVALIDVQEASFDVLEGTGKTKILQLATKAMDKSKKNTQEMIVGSYVGPWSVTKIDSAKNSYTEARVTIEYRGQRKILNMGKSEELGIFDEQGAIDNLENPIESIDLDRL